MTPQAPATARDQPRPNGALRRHAYRGCLPARGGALLLLASVVLIAFTAPDSRAAGPSACVPTGAPRSCRYAGLPLSDALADLRDRGLKLIFSSDLVRQDMIIAVEPSTADPRRVLARLLEPFGLEAKDGPAGTILIVQAAGAGGEAQRSGEVPPDAAGDRRPDPRAPVLRERVRVGASSQDEPAKETTLTRQDLRSLPAIGADPARSVAWLPGIAAADASAQISIRGGGSDDALVLLDGLGIDEPFHLQNILSFSSIVDAGAIGRADVLTGVFPAEYGSRMGGVLDLSTADLDAPPATTAELSLIGSGILTSGTTRGGDAGWLVSARSWYPNAVLDSIASDLDEIDPTYDDLLGKAQFRLPGGSILSAHLLVSRDTVAYRPDPGTGAAEIDGERRYAWLTWKTPLSERLYVQTLLSSGRSDRNRSGDFTGADGAATEVVDVRSHGFMELKQDWVFAAGERSSLKWGFAGRRVESEYLYGNGAIPGDLLAVDPAGIDAGAYVAGRFRIAAPLTVEVGVRREHQSLTAETETSPRVNLAFAAGEGTTLRVGWGRFSQPQQINELPIEDGVTTFQRAERAERWEAGVDHRFASGLALGLSAYVNDMTRLRPRYENLFDPFQLFPETEPDRVRVAPESALARGVEIALGMDRGRSLAWRASYALASAEDRIDGAWVPRSWDQRHTANFVLNYRRGRAWEVTFGGVYHTGWPATEMTAALVQNPDGSSFIQPIPGSRNAARYPDYHRLDLKVTRRFDIGRGTLGLYFDVTNLDGHDNVCCARGFEYRVQSDGSVRVDPVPGHWLQQHPVFGLTWEF